MARPKKKLTARQTAFVQAFVALGNASEAARRAGFSPRGASVRAVEMLAMPHVKAAIDKARKVVEEQYKVTKDRNIGESARIAYANALDYAAVGPDGGLEVDLSRLTREQAAAISELTVETTTVGSGESARTITRTRIKLHDKQTAIATLNKLLGYNAAEKIEATVRTADLIGAFESMLGSPPNAATAARDDEAKSVVDARKRALAEMEANNGHGSNGHKR